MEAYFQKHGLSASKFNIMMAAAFQNKGQGISQVRVARRMITTAGNITKLVDALFKDGLVTRVQNPDSRRENIVKITPEGRAVIDKLWPGYDKLVKARTNLISQKNQAVLAEILKGWFFELE